MGGIGSGRWPKGERKARTTERVSLDVRDLQRRGLLTSGASFGWGAAWIEAARVDWTWAQVAASPAGDPLRVVVEENRTGILLSREGLFQQRERIALVWSATGPGGVWERAWFVCPVCRRRCALVYAILSGDVVCPFACRLCSDLAYPLQLLHTMRRAAVRAHRLRAAVAGPLRGGDLLTPFPVRPLGMWRRTYDRQAASAQQAETLVRLRLLARKIPSHSSVFDSLFSTFPVTVPTRVNDPRGTQPPAPSVKSPSPFSTIAA